MLAVRLGTDIDAAAVSSAISAVGSIVAATLSNRAVRATKRNREQLESHDRELKGVRDALDAHYQRVEAVYSDLGAIIERNTAATEVSRRADEARSKRYRASD